MTIGQAIKKARKDRGYTATQLAQEAEISRITLFRWEQDKVYPNLLTLIDVANVLGVSLDELVGRKSVEVIRCKDCKKVRGSECPFIDEAPYNKDDFCSYGERKDAR